MGHLYLGECLLDDARTTAVFADPSYCASKKSGNLRALHRLDVNTALLNAGQLPMPDLGFVKLQAVAIARQVYCKLTDC